MFVLYIDINTLLEHSRHDTKILVQFFWNNRSPNHVVDDRSQFVVLDRDVDIFLRKQ
jgi:hypothetical protein